MFPYYGYGPDIWANGEDACKFHNDVKLHPGTNGGWIKPNLFGGACRYLILLGNTHDGDDVEATHQVTITR